MNDALALGRLHVFRCILDHLASRHGVGLTLVDRTGGATRLPVRDDTALGALAEVLAALPRLQEIHDGAMDLCRDVRDGELTEHPFGFQMLVLPCPVGGRPSRIVVLPLATASEHRKRQLDVKAHLREAGAKAASAERVSALLPAVTRGDVEQITELVSLLASEAALFHEQCQDADQRIERLRRRGRTRYSRIVSRSPVMMRLFAQIDKVVTADSTVFISGENGTGKELVAREIHEHSHRSHQPFVVQNCSALNENLLESELFGHKRGAFTGAIADKPGLFELADKGTFFLDEIGDMSPSLQVKVLRVLQEGTFSRVGDLATRRVDVRVICATNRDLRRMVREGAFREDLFYRINVIDIPIPPLRERRDDIPLLCDYFLQRTMLGLGNPGGRKRLSKGALDALVEYDWPGNVRELENEVERLVVMSGQLVTTLGEDLLSPHIRMRPLTAPSSASESGVCLPDALERMERAMIYERLKECRWNKTQAAAALGISRRNLIRKVERYGFEKEGGSG